MGTLTPFGMANARQDGAGENVAETLTSPPNEPLFTATNTQLWLGFSVFVAIFLVAMVGIIRARVLKPAERAARNTQFFEPAGNDADISFEEPADAGVEVENHGKKKKQRKKKPSERKGLDTEAPTDIAPEDAEASAAPIEIETVEPEEAPATTAEAEKPASVFAGIFDPPPANDETKDESTGDDVSAQPDLIESQEAVDLPPDDVRIDQLPEIDNDYWKTERDQQAAEDSLRAEEERRLALEEAERARTAAAEAEAARAMRDEEFRQEAAERQKAEAALDHSMQAVADMQGKLDDMAGRLSADAEDVQSHIDKSLGKKFASLSEELNQRVAAIAADVETKNIDTQIPRAGGDETAAKISARIEELGESMKAAIARLSSRVDALSVLKNSAADQPEELRELNKLLAERAAPAVAGLMQLGELVRTALPADRYELGSDLSTGIKADCMILRPGAPGIVIDARYPADAYDRYARADDKTRDHAATSYRRAILRHMIFIAEKLIVPDETEDFAILFVPNDAIFNDLHRHFADIVQDSYRARIWLTSPTSLMATLHMMNAAAGLGAETRTPAEQALEFAVDRLTERIVALEKSMEDAQPAPQTSQTEAQAQPVIEEATADATDDATDDEAPAAATESLPAAPEEAEVEIISPDDASARRPFPLR